MKKRTGLKALFAFACLLLLTAGAVFAVNIADVKLQEQECELLQEQVRRAAVDCYASEGRYPQEVEYLVEHYGLVYDETRYIIVYDAFASNIMPDISVIIRGEGRP